MTLLIDTAGLKVSLEPGTPPASLGLLVEASPAVTLGFSIFRLIPSGPQMMLGTNLAFDNEGVARIPLFDALPTGLYVVVTGPAPTDNRLSFPHFVPPPGGHTFWLGDGPPADLNAAVQTALEEHHAFANREFRAVGYEGSDQQTLHVLLDGCLLDYPQRFEGGYLQPVPHRLGVSSIVDAVNKLLPPGIAFGNASAIDGDYGREHPLALVTFNRVVAENDSAAIAAIAPLLQRILGALTLDRGANPTPLAYISERQGGVFGLRVAMGQIYRGNLAPGFGPGITGLMDVIERASIADPWTSFALELYRNVKLQRDASAQVYQAWAMLEAAAKRAVPRDPAVPVLNDAGEELSSQGRDLGRVIVYLRDHVGRNVLTLGLQPTGDFFQSLVRCTARETASPMKAA